MTNADEMLSLLDYLGKVAGKELGKEVHTAAKAKREKMDSKQVDTKTYKGKVMMYRREFLDSHFGHLTVVDITPAPTPDDDLPF